MSPVPLSSHSTSQTVLTYEQRPSHGDLFLLGGSINRLLSSQPSVKSDMHKALDQLGHTFS